MKTKPRLLLAAFLLSLITSGCMAPIPFLIKDYQVGKTTETSVGSAILRWASGMRRPLPQHDYPDTTLVFRSYNEIRQSDGTLKELIYKGTVDDKIQCVYREYVLAEYGAVAKPIFFLDVTYDLKQSKVIGYQDFKIKVENADQQKLVFTVLEEPSTMNEGNVRRAIRK